MIAQCFQAFQSILRCVLHLSAHIAQNINELLFTAIIVLTLDAPQIVVLLGSSFLFCAVVAEQGRLVFELVLIEGCQVFARESSSLGINHHLPCHFGHAFAPRFHRRVAQSAGSCSAILTGCVVDLLQNVCFRVHLFVSFNFIVN